MLAMLALLELFLRNSRGRQVFGIIVDMVNNYNQGLPEWVLTAVILAPYEWASYLNH